MADKLYGIFCRSGRGCAVVILMIDGFPPTLWACVEADRFCIFSIDDFGLPLVS